MVLALVALVIILLAVTVIRRRKARRQGQHNSATAAEASLGEEARLQRRDSPTRAMPKLTEWPARWDATSDW